MSNACKKYMDVDVLAFLEEKMKGNTEHYQSDFELDKQMIERYVQSEHKEDKTLLWLSRPYGTQCMRESEAFLKGTDAYHTWQYYADQGAGAKFVAFAIELKGVQDGVIWGNLYELNFPEHAKMAAKNAQPAYDVIKTFEDGHVAQVAFARSSYGYWVGLVEEHGPIVESRAIPSDKEMHNLVLAEQKRGRDKMKEAEWKPVSLEDFLKDAETRAGKQVSAGKDRALEMI